ncbi:hypothetical protein LTR05_005613 [Lithohypha guttulata]|uniref:Terpenoid synthase n=1 Tax=Lithohypha guttulata TaxID=1690604 RepID=A0AAN7SYF3_9EURO|nr:hypothetical protein LTR05_005613 [Lithohypha guttulata]
MNPKPTSSTMHTSSYAVDIQHHDTEGLAHGFQLRRHNNESEADEGSREARTDWVDNVGPIDVAGCCNPYSGHFAALTLPTCLPERLRIISYIFEYAFLHDGVMESATKAIEQQQQQQATDNDFATRSFDPATKAKAGSKKMQAKMVQGLTAIDPACAQVCIEAWKEMVNTTSRRDKDKPFTSMDEYLEYRIIDTGAPFVDKHMCFGMGIILDDNEIEQVREIAHAAYAALGLCNDYFSFDVEYNDFKRSNKKAMTNIVWLFMHWHGVDITEAKRLARTETRLYELKFLRLQQEADHTLSLKLRHYVQGLAYQIAGNAAWSTDNPRYHLDRDIYQDDMTDFDRSLACYHCSSKPAQSESGHKKQFSTDDTTAASSVHTRSSGTSPSRHSSRSSVSDDQDFQEVQVQKEED